VVAIDGPAGAGKSTTAKGVAAALAFTLVDTGSLYRAVALLAQEAGVDFANVAAVEALAKEAVSSGALRLAGAGRETRVMIRGSDPGEKIRTPALSMGASAVSAYPGVRAALLDAQRRFGRDGGVVLEGRDIGTVVFPEVKVFLTARPEVRARRRWEELTGRGIAADFDETLSDVVRRDAQDAQRAIAPLRIADDAMQLDASELTADEVISAIVARVRAVARGSG
jgi:cytidylate kinase